MRTVKVTTFELARVLAGNSLVFCDENHEHVRIELHTPESLLADVIRSQASLPGIYRLVPSTEWLRQMTRPRRT